MLLRAWRFDIFFWRVSKTKKCFTTSPYAYTKQGVNSLQAVREYHWNVKWYSRTACKELASFGNIDQQVGSLVNPYTYTGREFDSECGLYYYRVRYYDSIMGRFINEDPIGLLGGSLNFYRYVQNNPVNLVDPLGLAAGDWWDLPANFRRAREIAQEELQRRPTQHNDIGDAIRHAEWNRRMVEETNTFTAFTAGVGHEIDGLFSGQPLNEAIMDLHNNALGRSAGQTGSAVNQNDLWTLNNMGSQFNPYDQSQSEKK